MSKNINSFAENTNLLIQNSVNTLSKLAAIQESMTSNDTYVTYDYQDINGQLITYNLPSYESVINRLKAVEESINSLQTGRGAVNLSDGSRRTVTLTSIAHTPKQISGIPDPSTFTIDSNWFFEELMFPGATVNIDLTGQIEDSADRVRVCRIILDSNDDAAQSIWMSDLALNSYDYVSLKTILATNGVAYYEDEETVELPLVSNRVTGLFQVIDDPIVVDGNVWYELDTLEYSTIDNDGTDVGQNNILSIGNQISYLESIFEIVDVNQTTNKVRIKRICGVDTPGMYSSFNFYEDPFRSKILKVRFGAHEYNILYFKGVAEAHNLLADSWSYPVKFSSDELTLDATSALRDTTFAEYYNRYIVDWGANMIAEAKEARISAWHGSVPNAPVLNGTDFRVVQINTQINAAIDTTDVKNIAAEIESTKSQISSLKSTIAAQKTDLQSATNNYTYKSIQEQIASNTTDLRNLQTNYTTLVDSFQTIVRENSAITADPKYHIRGFFPVPEYKYQDAAETIAEEIIGFEIAYRYIKEDGTATQLNTFTYNAADGSEITGTFTDWEIIAGPVKTKVYDESLGRYVWKAENVADGTELNVNQIDIAISKGEKVEIKVRSISEAGYPENPLRSSWSNAIIIDFPATLATSNEIASLITAVNDDAMNITINNTLEAIGVTAHLADSVPNTDSVTGMSFNHMASNIAYEDLRVAEDGGSGKISVSLQEKIESLETVSDDNITLINKNMSDISAINALLKDKTTEYDNAIDDLNTQVDRIDASVIAHEDNFSRILTSDKQLKTDKLHIEYFDKEVDEYKHVAHITGDINGNVYVYDKDENCDDKTHLTSVHTSDTVLYFDGDENGLSLVQSIKMQNASINTNENHLSELDDYVDNVSSYTLTLATQESLDETNKKVADINSIIEETIIEGDILCKDLTLGSGEGETTLSTKKTTGSLYVLNGVSEELLGIVHAQDVRIYKETINGETDDLSDIISRFKATEADENALREEYDTKMKFLDEVITKSSANQIVIYSNTITSDDITTGTITAGTWLTIDGMEFAPKRANNQSEAVAGRFSDVYVEGIGGEESVCDKIQEYDNFINVSWGKEFKEIFDSKFEIYKDDDIKVLTLMKSLSDDGIQSKIYNIYAPTGTGNEYNANITIDVDKIVSFTDGASNAADTSYVSIKVKDVLFNSTKDSQKYLNKTVNEYDENFNALGFKRNSNRVLTRTVEINKEKLDSVTIGAAKFNVNKLVENAYYVEIGNTKLDTTKIESVDITATNTVSTQSLSVNIIGGGPFEKSDITGSNGEPLYKASDQSSDSLVVNVTNMHCDNTTIHANKIIANDFIIGEADGADGQPSLIKYFNQHLEGKADTAALRDLQNAFGLLKDEVQSIIDSLKRENQTN